MKSGLAAACVTAAFMAGLCSLAGGAARAQTALPDSPQVQTQTIPDSPRPNVVPDATAIAPGKGAPAGLSTSSDDDNGGVVPTSSLGSSTPQRAPAEPEQAAPDVKAELGPGGRVQTIRANVNFVQIPVTVKDKNGKLVPALDWRDFRVYENGLRKQIRFWTSDPFPLSIAFVIDQTLPFDVMTRVNNALGAVQAGFTPYDEMAIFTYNNSPVLRTDYTGAQSPRVMAVINQSKTTGREVYLGSPMGPLSQTINTNGRQFDPNTSPVRNSASTFQAPPKETHTLNDAILMAAQSLAKRPTGRRRIIYVVSDGKEYGSKAKFKDNIHFLQTNQIAVYSTIVGDSATKYIGFLDKYHIPFEMKGDVLPQYASQTGGEAVAEYRQRGIEESFAKVAQDVRLSYTIGYYTTEPLTDGKFRTVEVRVLRPGLDVVAKKGYYPTPENVMRTGAETGAAPRTTSLPQ